jgi:hypothetical protein
MSFITDAYDKGLRPRTSASGVLLLRDGRMHRVLVDQGGNLTAQGRAYEAHSGENLPVGGYDGTQAPTRQGNVETIKMRGGKESVVRRFDPATGGFKYTRLGSQFYAQRRTQYIIRVAATFAGTRPDNTPYSRPGFWPIQGPISLPQNLTDAQRDARIRAHVMGMVQGGVLAEFSQERVSIRDAPWEVSELITSPSADGPQTSVRERRLGTAPAVCSSLLFPDHITPAAFLDSNDFMCCPRQIAEVTRRDFHEVCEMLDACEQSLYGEALWRAKGCTASLVFEYARRLELGACLLHTDRVLETLEGKRPLTFTVLESHAFFYATPKICRTLANRRPHDFERLKREVQSSTTPDASEWVPLGDGLPPPGHYCVAEDEIGEVRGRFLASGRRPKVLLKDAFSTKALRYTFVRGRDTHKGVVHIHTLPEHATEIQTWLKALDIGIPYRGEGLPNASYKVLLKLLKVNRQRRCLTGDERHTLLEANSYACTLCGERAQLEWDHTHRFSESFGEQAMLPLCKACHAAKTATEPHSIEPDPLASHFEQAVFDGYVMSPRPPPLVFKAKAFGELEGLRIVDVRRCRMRALMHNVHEIPVFCPLDDIQPTGTTLGDIVYASKPSKCFIRDLGYTGPGWMHRVQAEFLLHHGVLKWTDLPWKLNATGRLPADIFKLPLEQMEAAWGDTGLGKKSINSMIGLFCIDECFNYRLLTSDHPGDIPPNCIKRLMHYPGGVCTDLIVKTRLKTTTSMRPIHDLCMCTEAVRIGTAIYALKRQRATIYEFKTDSILYRPLKRARHDVLETVRMRDLDLRVRFEKTSGERRLDDHHDLRTIDSDELVFRVEDACERDPMKMEPKRPSRDADYVHRPSAMEELSEEEARARVARGESLLVEGIAGVGKTHFLQSLVEELRAKGKSVCIISKTHCASARAGGITADAFVRRYLMHGSCLFDVVWADEVYQLECTLLAQLNKIASRQWLLSGDCHQFPPMFNSFRGGAIDDDAFGRSNLLKTLCGRNRLTLKVCRRSDGELFAWYSSLIRGGSRFHLPLAEVLQEARTRFRLQGHAAHNLVISHRRRIQLNREANCRERGRQAVLVRGAMWVWPGLKLLGSAGHRKIQNGITYEITSVSADTITLGDITLTFPQAAASLRLAHAQTYASVQGSEFSGTLALWDTDNRHFTMRHLFVALSRAKRAEDICVN